MFLFRSSAEAQSRPVSATEAGINRVVAAIRSAAQTTGAGFDYLMRTAQRESSLQPTAQASTSSARGLYQFIDSTWLATMRDEGPRLGLGRYAAQIGTGAGGQPVVSDPQVRQQILALRDDPQVSALMAGAFTNRNAADLRAATGRDPTEGELYMAHFLGAGGASRLIALNASAPQSSAAVNFPDAASANRRIFFDNGRARTVSEVYQLLSAGQSTAVAGGQAQPTAATTSTAATTAATTGTAAVQAADPEPDRNAWASIPKVNAAADKPFHSLFSSDQGPINAFVASTWASLGRGRTAGQTVTVPASLTAPATEAAAPLDLTPAAAGQSVATAPLPAARPQAVGPVGGPYVPIAAAPRRNEPLDLASFMRSPAGR